MKKWLYNYFGGKINEIINYQPDAELPEKAKKTGLLGNIIRDLSPYAKARILNPGDSFSL